MDDVTVNVAITILGALVIAWVIWVGATLIYLLKQVAAIDAKIDLLIDDMNRHFKGPGK